ncbi:AAA family ATPase [Succinimonas sp.]|uniref:AAA family ATPase n=1 Tax=Succinimonas sp. TaxID=1936151 RepID=UPI003869D619
MAELLTSRNFAADDAEDFENLIRRKLYVDKTSFLEDLMHRAKVLQILRPRGFGKTLFMSMLASFLEMNYLNPEDRSRPERLFKDLAVCKNKAFCDEYMGRFPVIIISLKSVQGEDFPEAMKAMMRVLGPLFKKFAFLADSKKQHPSVAAALRRRTEICCSNSFDLTKQNNMSTAESIAVSSLLFLSDMLHIEYDRRAFIIVDGYDDPLEAAAKNGYYPEMLDVIALMLETALKTNDHLETGFVTGNLHISFQSIYSGFNNYVESDINDRIFADFMGFTEDETAALLKAHGIGNRLPDVLEWYDGYNFAGHSMLCPWSVLKFLSRALDAEHDPAIFQPENYWANSSGNDIIDICMRRPRAKDIQRFQNLLEGKTEEIVLREFTTYPAIISNTDFDTFATLMLHTGYLTVAKDAVPSARNRAVVRIPNNEVLECFSDKADTIFSESNPEWLEKAMTLRDALLGGDTAQAQDIMNAMLRRFISVRDTSHEYYYHMFLSGVLSMTAEENIDVISQIEKGDGYPDIVIDNKRNKEAVILELKKSDGQKFSQLKKWAEDALDQIRTNAYDRDFKDRKYLKICNFGISFFGKECLALKMPDDSAAK